MGSKGACSGGAELAFGLSTVPYFVYDMDGLWLTVSHYTSRHRFTIELSGRRKNPGRLSVFNPSIQSCDGQ